MSEEYDRAVEDALERKQSPEEYLRYLTTSRIDPLQEALEAYWNALNAQQITKRLKVSEVDSRLRTAWGKPTDKLEKTLNDFIDELSVTALKVKRERDSAISALYVVRELIEGYMDVKDGPNGPVANDAMKAIATIDVVLAKCDAGRAAI